MFYLTTHSTHFIVGYMAIVIPLILIFHIDKEENVLFNDALNTLYMVIWRQTYG